MSLVSRSAVSIRCGQVHVVHAVNDQYHLEKSHSLNHKDKDDVLYVSLPTDKTCKRCIHSKKDGVYYGINSIVSLGYYLTHSLVHRISLLLPIRPPPLHATPPIHTNLVHIYQNSTPRCMLARFPHAATA